MNYHELEHQLTTWAETQPDVIAIVAIGSRGRVHPPPDEHSDLDVLLWTDNLHRYADADDWLHTFGQPILCVFSHTDQQLPEWEIIFKDGGKLDVVLIEALPTPLATMLREFAHADVLQRGFRVLVNKRGDDVDASHWSFAAATRPDQTRFDHLIKEVLLEATRALKFAQRGDLWRAKNLCDNVMKKHLLTLLEWHALAKYGDELDIWYDGRFLEQWADAEAVQALPGTFALYEGQDIIRALHATMTLFDRLGRDTAQRDGLNYTGEATQAVLHWLAAAHRSRPVAPLYDDLYTEEEATSHQET